MVPDGYHGEDLSAVKEPETETPETADVIVMESPLTLEQTQRAGALGLAREVLKDEKGPQVFGGGTVSLPKRFGTQDLIDLASWILSGEDPLAAYREESERRFQNYEQDHGREADEAVETPGSVQRGTARGI